MAKLRVLMEAGRKRVFAVAIDWPGLARSGKTDQAAIEALLEALPRYAIVANAAGQPFDLGEGSVDVDVIERVDGDATTDFGAPGIVAVADRRPLTQTEAGRQAALVKAAWEAFDQAATRAPESLRKGPRGGGRDRSKIVDHLDGSDRGYATVMGVKAGAARPIEDVREDMRALLKQASDGSPLAGKRWPSRYAARRVAWHALDHAWEIEDRAEPG